MDEFAMYETNESFNPTNGTITRVVNSTPPQTIHTFQSHKWYNYKELGGLPQLTGHHVSIPQMVQLQVELSDYRLRVKVVSIPQMVQLQVLF